MSGVLDESEEAGDNNDLCIVDGIIFYLDTAFGKCHISETLLVY